MNQRGRRVAELIQREIGMIVNFEMRDPRIKDITITAVKVSDDLGYAKIYFISPAPKDDSKAIAKALNHAQGFLRSKIGERIEMKYVPELKFFFDESLEYASHMEALFKSIKRD